MCGIIKRGSASYPGYARILSHPGAYGQIDSVPRKYFKKYLPSHDEIGQNKYLKFFGPILRHHNLWHLHRRSVAGGVAAGAFAGLIPGPVQMFGAALLAIIFRVNLPVAMVTTLYTNPFTIVPLTYLAYKIGTLVTNDPTTQVPSLAFDWRNGYWADFPPLFINWMTALGGTYLIGLLILASFLSISGYILVRILWRFYLVIQWRRRQHRRREHNF